MTMLKLSSPLKTARIHAKLSRRDLSTRTGVSVCMIARLENLTSRMTQDLAERLTAWGVLWVRASFLLLPPRWEPVHPWFHRHHLKVRLPLAEVWPPWPADNDDFELFQRGTY